MRTTSDLRMESSSSSEGLMDLNTIKKEKVPNNRKNAIIFRKYYSGIIL